MGSYRELIVWQKAIQLAKETYDITSQFPKSETYGLAAQMNKCGVSIASNIAEGSRRRTKNDFRHFVTIAYGPGAELETQIEISKQLPFSRDLDFSKVDALLSDVMRLLNKLESSLLGS